MKFKSFMSLVQNMSRNCRFRQIFMAVIYEIFMLWGYVIEAKF